LLASIHSPNGEHSASDALSRKQLSVDIAQGAIVLKEGFVDFRYPFEKRLVGG
jgi:hypothetical protein